MLPRGQTLSSEAGEHAFVRRPHRTLVVLSLPVLASLVAEPLTGLVDTFFVAQLGALELAALGVATLVLSSVFWAFNFLGIGTQSEVANALGAGRRADAREVSGLAAVLAGGIGVLLAALAWPFVSKAAVWMGASGEMVAPTAIYLRIRLLGAPAILLLFAAFGVLRGLQDMRTPLWIAGASNALNIALDPLLIFGAGPLPGLGVAGAAAASSFSQWLAAGTALVAVQRRLGWPGAIPWRRAPALMVVGRDLFVRTGALLLFQLLATRTATQIGVEAAAANQVVRTFWSFSAFLLDAFALVAQSLVGYFVGGARVDQARRVAAVACQWSLGSGVVLGALMLAFEGPVANAFLPPEARPLFHLAWLAVALAQPLASLSFATDGIHWGTRDYAYLRNAILTATALGAAALASIDRGDPSALLQVWLATALWLSVRTVFGIVRIWPGMRRSPLLPPGR